MYATLNEQLGETLSQSLHIRYIPCEVSAAIEDAESSNRFTYRIGIDDELVIKTKTYSFHPQCGYENDFSIKKVLPKGAPDQTWIIDS